MELFVTTLMKISGVSKEYALAAWFTLSERHATNGSFRSNQYNVDYEKVARTYIKEIIK
jgi:hypothetical protein